VEATFIIYSADIKLLIATLIEI